MLDEERLNDVVKRITCQTIGKLTEELPYFESGNYEQQRKRAIELLYESFKSLKEKN